MVKCARYGVVLSLLIVGGCGNGSGATQHERPMRGGDLHGVRAPGDTKSMPAMMTMMYLGEADSTYDVRLLAMMIPHHEVAVTMARDALSNSSRQELKELARSIIDAQEREIATMRQWRSRWSGAMPDGGGGNSLAMNDGMAMGDELMARMVVMGAQMTARLAPQDAGYEQRFIDMMIPHHQGAIGMAKDAVHKATHPELRELARDIIVAQGREIAQMTEWRVQWYGH